MRGDSGDTSGGEGGAAGRFGPANPLLAGGKIALVTGSATVTRSGETFAPLKVGDPVFRGDIIETGADGRVSIHFRDGTTFEVSNRARMALKECPDADDAPPTLVDVQRGDFAFIAGEAAKADRLEIDTPFARIRSRATAGGIGTLSLASLLFAAMEEAEALAPKHEYYDDEQIAEDYSEEPHGRFVLDTKEAIPRRILVEDPGVTYALRLTSSSEVSVSQIANSPAQMAQFRVIQQNVLQTYSVGLSAFQGPANTGPNGSTTNPNLELPQGARPISFSPSDNGGVTDPSNGGSHDPAKTGSGAVLKTTTTLLSSSSSSLLPPSPPPPPPEIFIPPPEPPHFNTNPLIGPLSVPDPGPIGAPVGSGTMSVSNNFSFSDADVADTHSITSTFNASASDVGAPLGSFDASKQTDTVNGSGGVAHWEYHVDATTVNTLPAGTVRHEVFDVVVSDGQGGFATHQVTITINGPANNPPVIQNVGGGAPETVAEDGSVLLHAANASVTDADGDTLTMTVHVTHGTLVPAASVPGLTIIDGGGDDTIVVSGSAAVITDAIKAGVIYSPDHNYNGPAELDLTIDDDQGGTSTATVAINVTPVNDAPIATGSATLAAINEDAANPPGATVASLFVSRFSDPADNQLPGGSAADTFSGIAISAYTADAGKGVWQYSTDGGGSWSPLGNATTTNAITLNATDLLRFVPAANFNGAATALSANLIESGQAITSGATLDLTGAVGGTTHISTTTVALSETINPVNDTPTVANAIPDQNATQGSQFTFQFGANAFNDVDGDTLLYTATKDDGTPLPGWLTFTAGTRTFSGTPGNSDVGQLAIKVTASDGSASASDTFNIAIANINDAPAIQNVGGAVPLAEDSSVLVQAPSNASVMDVDGDTLTMTLHVSHGTFTPAAGVPGLTVIDPGGDDTMVVSGSAAAITNAIKSGMNYTPTANFNGPDALQISVTDGQATTSATVNLNVAAVNDAPVATGSATLAAISEDAANSPGATIASLFGGNFSDATDQVPGGSTANIFAGIAVSSYTADASKGAWQYSINNGGNWTSLGSATTTAAVTLNATDLLRFVPATNYNGPATALSVNLIESGQSITSGATINLTGATGGTAHISAATVALSETVNAVNDPPIVAQAIADQNATQGSAFNFAFAANTFSDVDGDPLSYTATKGDGTPLPAWLIFTAATRTFAGTPSSGDVGTLAVKVTASDGSLSTFDTFNIVVGNTNDAPVIQNVGGTAPVAEDGSVLLAAANALVSDADGDILTMTVSVGHGSLSPSAAILAAISNHTLSSSDTNGSDGSLSVTGSASAISAAIQAGINYAPNANYNGTDALDVAISDGQLTTHASVAINVSAVNDAPVATGSATLTAINEDTVNPPGATVASLFNANFSDAADNVPGGSTADSFSGIAISSYTADVNKGTWQYSTDGTNWNALGSATTTTAITLKSTDFLRFVPAANYNGAATALSANLIETGPAIASGATIDLTGATGGTTHISSAAVALSHTVNAVNDAPIATITAASYSATEQTSLSLKNNGLSIGDIDAGNGSVTVTLSVGEGILTVSAGTSGALVSNSGTASVTITGTVAQVNALLNTNGGSTVSYIDNSDAASASTVLTLQVNDNGNTGSGGALNNSATVPINIIAVNDAPNLAAITAPTATPEAVNAFQQDIAAIHGTLSVSDPDVGNTLTASIAGGPVVQLNGQPFTLPTGAVISGLTQSYIKNLVTGDVSLVAGTATGSIVANAATGNSIFSPDGSKIVFSSVASNLVPNDTNGSWDTFVKDLATGTITRISTSDGLQQIGGQALPQFGLAWSPDGTKVAYGSTQSNLVPGDTNGEGDLYVRDLVTNTVQQITVTKTGVEAVTDKANGHLTGVYPVFSPDGTKVLFRSDAANLVAGDNNNAADIFIKDLVTGDVTRVSTDSNGNEGGSGLGSFNAAFSPDGTKVVFSSQAALAPGANVGLDLFIKDLTTNVTTRIATGTGASDIGPVFSPDGTKVLFYTVNDVFIVNLANNAVTRVSETAAHVGGDGQSAFASFSPDGTKVLFYSLATNLVPNDTNAISGQTQSGADWFVKDLITGDVTRISTDAAGTQGNPTANLGAIFPNFTNPHWSPDGQYIVFDANFDNMLQGSAELAAAGALTFDGTATSDGTTKTIGWTYDPAAANLDFLRANQTLTLTYTVTIGDGTTTSNTQPLVITVIGANDAPVLSGTASPAAIPEAANASAQDIVLHGALLVSDKDVGDTLSALIVGSPTVTLNGPFSLPAGATALISNALSFGGPVLSDGGVKAIAWTYDPAAANLDFLAAGQQLKIAYTVKVNDQTADSATQTLTFTITGTNDTPIVAQAIADQNATQGSAFSFQFGAGAFSDVDGDTLTYTATKDDGGALPSWLTFTPATRSFTGTPGSGDVGTLAVKVTASDGSLSASDTFNIVVGNINDAPAIQNVGGTTFVAEDSSVLLQAASAIVTDADNDTLTMTINVTHGALTPSQAILDAIANHTLTSSDPDGSNGSLSVTGSASAIQAAIRSGITYAPTANFNGVDALAVSITDGQATTPATVNITVTAVNDAPVATSSATLGSINEDPANPPGATVSSLFSANFSDATDSVPAGSSANSFAGIAISSYTVDSAKGAWQYSHDNGNNWTVLNTATLSTAVTLNAADMLRFVPAANYNGPATALSANLIETGFAITTGATVDLTVAGTGGTTHVSTATVVLSETINAVNDAPTFHIVDTLTRISVPDAILLGTVPGTDPLAKHAIAPDMSGDGRFVVFFSTETVPTQGGNDDITTGDIFLFDRLTGTTTTLTDAQHIPFGLREIGEHFQGFSISGDGYFAVINGEYTVTDQFGSHTVNKVYIYDRKADQVTLLTDSATHATINPVSDVQINGGGSLVTLVRSDNTGGQHVSVYNRDGVLLTDITSAHPGIPDTLDHFDNVSISNDGRYISFWAFAQDSNFQPTGTATLFVFDRQTNSALAVGTTTAGHDLWAGSLNRDGHFVVFQSDLNLDSNPADIGNSIDVFVYDTSAHTLQRVSSVPSGIANGDSIRPNISPDGRFVTFASTASNLVPGDSNGQPDTFVKDLQTGLIERVSVAVDGTQGNGDSSLASSINGGGTGTYIAFGSAASNLVPGDGNAAADIFVLDRSGGTAGQVVEDSSVSASGFLSTYGSFSFSDMDLADAHTATVTGVAVTTLGGASASLVVQGGLGTFTPTISENTGDADPSGLLSWTFTVDNAALANLNNGERIQQVYTVQVSDGHGGNATQDVTITLVGITDQPTLTITALTSDAIFASGNDPIQQMGSGTVQPGGTSTQFTIVNTGVNRKFVFDGYGFTFDASHAPTGGLITAIHEFTDDATPTALADFTGVGVSASAWYAAAVEAAANGPNGPQPLLDALTSSWAFKFIGGPGPDTFNAGDQPDNLSGGGGDDFLLSSAGNDSLNGGSGDDTLGGGAGNDLIIGGDGQDRAIYFHPFEQQQVNAVGPISVQLAAGTVTTFTDPTHTVVDSVDTLRSIERVDGSSFDDTFNAVGFSSTSTNAGSIGVGGSSDGTLNEFEGYGGNDTITGNGNTRVSYVHALAGVAVTFTSFGTGSAHGIDPGDVAGIGNDTFVSGVIRVRGSNFNDTFTGSNNPANTGEFFEGRGGDDFINGGGGFDVAVYGNEDAKIDVQLAAGDVFGGVNTGHDILRSVEGISGTDFNDTFNAQGFTASSTNAGSAGVNGPGDAFNRFEGRDGDDSIVGNGNTQIAFDNAAGGVTVTFTSLGAGTSQGTAPGDAANVGHDTFSGVNSVRGSEFDDIIGPDAGNDSFDGRGGNDTLWGGAGNDTLTGGNGIDRAIYTDATGPITVNLAAANNNVTGAGIGTDTLSSVESIRGSAFDDIFSAAGYLGASAIGSITTNFSEFEGMGGNDSITGSGRSAISYLSATDKVTVDLLSPTAGMPGSTGVAHGTVSDAGIGNDIIFGGVSVVRGSAFDDTLLGSNTGDSFEGRGGNDFIDGRGGSDRVFYEFATDNDVTSGIIVELADGDVTSIDSAIGHDTLRSIEMIRGTSFNDVYDATGFTTSSTNSGNAGFVTIGGVQEAFNEFEGLGGNDVITGNGDTRISFVNATSGVTVDLATGSATGDASVGTDTITGGVNAVTGSAFADTLFGSNNGSSIAEVFDGGGGNDTIVGRGGFDQVVYNNSINPTAGISVDMQNGTVTSADPSIGADHLNSIESIRGTNFVDQYVATNYDGASDDLPNGTDFNEFEGLGGNDIITGNGNTRISYISAPSGVTVDLSTGTATGDPNAVGTDTFTGVNRVRGSNFDDRITGDSNNNTFDGRGGNDTFVFKPMFGHDTITDFQPGQDTIEIDHTVFSDFADLQAHMGPPGTNTVITDANNDTITLLNVAQGNLHASDFHFV